MPLSNEGPLIILVILIEIDDENENESEYRLRVGNRVKYLKVAAAYFDRATFPLPIAYLPPLPYEVEQLTIATFEAAICRSTTPNMAPPLTRVIANITRFEWEILGIERETRETRAYQLLQQRQSDLAPQFLGHIHEGGRVIGFLLEKLEDRRHVSIGDLRECELVLGKFHSFGFSHSDANQYDSLVGKDEIKLIDFECLRRMPQKMQEQENCRACL